MKGVTYMLAFLLILAAGVWAGHIGLDRVEHAQALHCARTSIGTDSAIVDCYTSRGLAIPEDMK